MEKCYIKLSIVACFILTLLNWNCTAIDKKTENIEAKVQDMDYNNIIFLSNVKTIYEPSGRIQAVFESNVGYRRITQNEFDKTDILIGLFFENGRYSLRQEHFFFDHGFDECTGDSTLSFVSNARFLFLNFNDYNKGDILPILSKKKEMLPDTKFTFEFYDKKYEMEAFGEKGVNEYNVTNYSLIYSEKGVANKQMIVNIPRIEGISVQLLFIGDLDGDGKPDVILETPSNYENQIIVVFLSSTAKNGNYLNCEAQKSDWFDC